MLTRTMLAPFGKIDLVVASPECPNGEKLLINHGIRRTSKGS
jgi:hypothetical protein